MIGKKKMVFGLLVCLLVAPLILSEVQGAISGVTIITNPHTNESFEFSDTSETFTGYYQGTGYVADFIYQYQYEWKIDSVVKNTGSGSVTSSHGGVVQVDDELDYSMNPGDYSVGSHTVYLEVYIVLMDTETDINTWHRAADPNNDPVITITAPATDYEIHNRTLSGNDYTISWSVNDDDGTISSMAIYFDGVLNNSWVNPAETTYNRVLTCTSDATYTIIINCTDDDSATDEETIHLVALTGGTGYIIITDPDGTRHSERISFTIDSTDADGLNNLSVSVNDYELETTVTKETCNLTYDQLVVMASGYQAINYSVDYSSVDIWVEDSLVDDDCTGEGDPETSSESWNWSYTDQIDRIGGYFYFWEDDNSVDGYIYHPGSVEYLYCSGETKYFYEYNLTYTNSTAKYESIVISSLVHWGPNYVPAVLYNFSISKFQIGFASVANPVSSEIDFTEFDLPWNQNSYTTIRIAVDWDNDWVAYYINGTFLLNETITFNEYSTLTWQRTIVNNAVGENTAMVKIDYFKTGWAEWETSDVGTVGLDDDTDDLISGIGIDYYVNFTSTSVCRFWGTITTTYMITYWVYESSAETSQTNNWEVTSANWTNLSEGDHIFIFNIGDDSGNIVEYNRTYTVDTTAPTITITLPYNASEWFVSEVPSLNYQLDWGGNDGDDTNELIFELNYNSTNGLTVSWVVSESVPLHFPTSREKIVDSFGEYYVRMRAIDSAGNVAYSSIVYFEVFNERTISISCTSQYDSSSIDVDHYLDFYVDGIRYSYNEIVVKADTYEFIITDKFGNELYESDNEVYASTKSYQLPLRRCALTNALSRLGRYVIAQDGGNSELEGYISSSGQEYVYLFDGSYTIGYEPVDIKISDNEYYIAKSFEFVCSSSSNAVVLTAEIIRIAGGGSDTADIERTMTLFIVGVSIGFVVLLAFVVVKDSLGGVVKKGYAKLRGREYKSSQDSQAEKNYSYQQRQEKRKKRLKKEAAEKKRLRGFPQKPAVTNDEYRKRFG